VEKITVKLPYPILQARVGWDIFHPIGTYREAKLRAKRLLRKLKQTKRVVVFEFWVDFRKSG
jgi:hypothetical protein